MKQEEIRRINMQMENQFGEGGIMLIDTSLGGTQITWGNMCIGHADYETLHELIYELTVLKDYIEATQGLSY